MREILINQTSDASGDSVDTSESSVYGQLYAIEVVDGDLVDNFDITITYTNSRGGVITLSTFTNLTTDAIYYPRAVLNDLAGGALAQTTGSDGVMPMVAGVITSTLGDGGATKTGAVILHII